MICGDYFLRNGWMIGSGRVFRDSEKLTDLQSRLSSIKQRNTFMKGFRITRVGTFLWWGTGVTPNEIYEALPRHSEVPHRRHWPHQKWISG